MKRTTSKVLITLSFTLFSGVYFLPQDLKADTLHVSNAISPVQMVQEVLIGGGVATSNITYSGSNLARGKFWGGPGSVGIEEGIILTSGNISIAPGPNNSGGAGQSMGTPGDPDLNMVSGVSTFDASILEFDFIPQSDFVTFKYVFASEEYHEYVFQYNDAFGFFISGPGISGPFSNNSRNIALLPLSDIPVSINTVNYGNPYGSQCTNCAFFVNNPPPAPYTQYDAFTVVLTAVANVIPCQTYHIKLAIADGVDRVLDSGVFLQANSFSSLGVTSEVEYTQAPNVNFAIEGCSDATITFTLSTRPTSDFYLPLFISGTATNGVDYETIPDSVFFQADTKVATMDIITIPDDIAEWVETIQLVYNSSLCDINYDTVLINLWDYRLTVQTTSDTTINCGTPANIGVRNVSGYGPFSYGWSTGETTDYITVSPLITTTYYVNVTGLCDSTITDSVTVFVNGPEAEAGPDAFIPYGTSTQLHGSASQGSGDYEFNWSPPELLVDPNMAEPTTVLMDQNTQFTLTVTDLAGGCLDIDQMMLFVSGGPLNAGPVAEPAEICPGEFSQLYAYPSGGSENYTYLWSSDPPGFNSSLQNPIVQPVITTVYYVVVDDGYSFVTRSVTVTVSALPIPEAGENDTIWHGTYGLLYGTASQGSGSYTWWWEPADKLISPYSQNPVTKNLYETTLFRLEVTDNITGCVSEDEDIVYVVVIGGPLAVTVEVTDPMICRGATTQVHALASGGDNTYTYQWSSDPPGFTHTDQSPYVSPIVTTTYYVVVDDGFNTTNGSVTVEVSPLPSVYLGADIVTCPFDTVELSVNLPGMTYYWSNGSVGSSISVGTTGIGFDLQKIWVQVTSPEGCVNTDTILVIFDFAECSGIGENEDGIYLAIYPNPSTGEFQVEWQGLSGKVNMMVTDLHGRMVLENQLQTPPSGEFKGSLNLDHQPRGIYLLRIIGEEHVLTRKILLN